jgi:hypothetical protein
MRIDTVNIDGLDIDMYGIKRWYKDNKLHREDGPAIENNGINYWYYNGTLVKCSSQKDFERLLRLKLFW